MIDYPDPHSNIAPKVKDSSDRFLRKDARLGSAIALTVGIQAYPTPIYRYFEKRVFFPSRAVTNVGELMR